MSKSAGELLLQRVHQVVRAAKLWEEFETTTEQFTLTVENEPYMSLIIESWPIADSLQGERRHVLVAHYYTVKEQRYPDPELVMTEYGFPVRLRQTVFGILETPLLWRDPQTQDVLVNIRGKRDVAELLRIWAKNIGYQGFAQAASRIIPAARSKALSPMKEDKHLPLSDIPPPV
ncbi:hypothetical protein KSF_106880 [Reticulibacter mediterranei]|uniref:DUF6908 domain-containing protein n=1 Tax=Reticulibacter mediterranei TaxID=2778369 RepID=A0A8J3IY66_9CHLR|nr:hypothetical protein [Reticulibacter mediterranei]GHP00641.1 hypothetical protein KSF_106880 [Reticulibacter mediterranei]